MTRAGIAVARGVEGFTRRITEILREAGYSEKTIARVRN